MGLGMTGHGHMVWARGGGWGVGGGGLGMTGHGRLAYITIYPIEKAMQCVVGLKSGADDDIKLINTTVHRNDALQL